MSKYKAFSGFEKNRQQILILKGVSQEFEIFFLNGKKEKKVLHEMVLFLNFEHRDVHSTQF